MIWFSLSTAKYVGLTLVGTGLSLLASSPEYEVTLRLRDVEQHQPGAQPGRAAKSITPACGGGESQEEGGCVADGDSVDGVDGLVWIIFTVIFVI